MDNYAVDQAPQQTGFVGAQFVALGSGLTFLGSGFTFLEWLTNLEWLSTLVGLNSG